MAPRTAAVLGLLVAPAILSYGWAAIFGAIGAEARMVGRAMLSGGALPFLVVGGAWMFIDMIVNGHFGAALFLLSMAAITGQMARKFAYPGSKFSSDPASEPAVQSLRL